VIVLKLLREPAWHDSPFHPGVRVKLRPLDSGEAAEARHEALAVVHSLRASADLLKPYGLDGPDGQGRVLNPADPAQMLRLGVLVEGVEMAVRAVQEWEGVVDEAGRPAAVTRRTLSMLMQDDSFDRWLRSRMEAANRILADEKNGLRLSPSGGAGSARTESDPTTAPTAEPAASPAPGESPAATAASAPSESPRP
jgi:hypothetical protein